MIQPDFREKGQKRVKKTDLHGKTPRTPPRVMVRKKMHGARKLAPHTENPENFAPKQIGRHYRPKPAGEKPRNQSGKPAYQLNSMASSTKRTEHRPSSV